MSKEKTNSAATRRNRKTAAVNLDGRAGRLARLPHPSKSMNTDEQTYSAGRAHLTITDRLAFLTQDVLQLERSRPAEPARDVLRRRGPQARAFFDDVHNRENLLGWVKGLLSMIDKYGVDGTDTWLRNPDPNQGNFKPITLADYLTKMEDEVAAFKVGGVAAQRAHIAQRNRKEGRV